MKLFLLIIEIILVTLGFVIVSLGHTDLVSSITTPDAYASIKTFVMLKQGQQVTKESHGYLTLVKALKHYCAESQITIDWETYSVEKFENRYNFINELVFHVKFVPQGELTIGFTAFKLSLDMVASRANLPLALGLFVVGILLMVATYIVEFKGYRCLTRR